MKGQMEPEGAETFDVWLLKELRMCLMSVTWVKPGRSKSKSWRTRLKQYKIYKLHCYFLQKQNLMTSLTARVTLLCCLLQVFGFCCRNSDVFFKEPSKVYALGIKHFKIAAFV